LCISLSPLEVWEAEEIGFTTAIRLAKAREGCLRLCPGARHPNSEEVKRIVWETFRM